MILNNYKNIFTLQNFNWLKGGEEASVDTYLGKFRYIFRKVTDKNKKKLLKNSFRNNIRIYWDFCNYMLLPILYCY